MRILGMEIEVHDGLCPVRQSSDDNGVFFVVYEGVDIDAMADSVVTTATACGFRASHRAVDRVVLNRGEQKLLLIRRPSQLTIQATDPTVLPMAKQKGSVISFAGFSVDMGNVAITPLREENIGKIRRSAWRVYGIAASEATQRVIEWCVVQEGFVRGAAFGPAVGGLEIWTGEAFLGGRMIKATATVEHDYVVLEVDSIEVPKSAAVQSP